MIRFSAMLILLLLTGGMHAIAANSGEVVSHASLNQAMPSSDMVQARMQLFQQSITWFGQVESRHAIELVSRVAGRIQSLKVEDESNVYAGDILFELAGKAVESRITDLKQQRHQADKELAIAKKTLRLINTKKQQHLATNEQLNAAQNAVAQVKGRISGLRQSLISLTSGIHVTAPADGVFTARSVQVGQYIQAGTRLARIVDTHHLRIRATLFPPADITNLKRLNVIIHGAHGDISGTVAAIMPETTAEGGVQVWITWPHANNTAQNRTPTSQNMPPGIQLSGNIFLPHKAVAVPQSALARDDAGHTFVFVHDRNKWRKQEVITGMRDPLRVEIRSGLDVGEQVATTGVYEMLYHDFSSIYHEPD